MDKSAAPNRNMGYAQVLGSIPTEPPDFKSIWKVASEYLICVSSVGQSMRLLIPRSSVRFRQKLQKPRTQIYMDLSYIYPQKKGTEIQLQVIKAIINQYSTYLKSYIVHNYFSFFYFLVNTHV